MKKIAFFACYFLVLGKLYAQPGPKIEDYKAMYNPDYAVFTQNGLPPNALRITNTQAQVMLDKINLNIDGKISDIRIPAGADWTQYYKIDDMVLSVSCRNDSARWYFNKLIKLPLPNLPPNQQPQYGEVPEEDEYENPYHIFNIEDLETFCYYSANAQYPERKLRYRSRAVSRPGIDLVINYFIDSKITDIMAFSKSYKTRIYMTVRSTLADKQKAIDVINWIADHVEIDANTIEFK